LAELWTLRRRIGVGYLLLLVLAVASAVVANVAFNSILASQDQVSAIYGRNLVVAEQLRTSAEEATSSVEAYALTGNRATLDQFAAARERFGRQLGELRGQLRHGKAQALADQIRRAQGREESVLRRMVAARETGASPAQFSALEEELWSTRTALVDQLSQLTALEDSYLAEARRASLQQAKRAREFLTLIAAVALAAAALGALLYTRALALRIERDQEKQRFRLLVDGVPDYAIVQLDAQGRVETWSVGAERLFGYAAGEVVGRSFDRFYPAEEQAQAKERLERAVREGRVEEGTWRPRKDGSRFFASGLLAPLWGPRGEVRAFAFICRDVTGQKEAEEERNELLSRERTARHELRGALRALQKSERRERRLSDSNLIGVFFFDMIDGIVEANDAFLRLIGHPRREAFPLQLRDLVPPEEHRTYARGMEELRQRGVCVPFETALWDGVGGRMPVMMGAALLEGSQREGVAFVLDLRERKRAEEALRFLAEASTTLVSSLDYATTLARVARLSVPKLADWCMVELEDPDGRLRRVAVVHRDPQKDELAQRLLGPLGSGEAARPPVLGMVEPELVADVEALMREVAAGPSEHAVVRELGFNSAMVVPLLVRNRALGAILLVSAGERRYGEADLALAEDLARRCAAAVDNARLYQEAQEAIRVRDEFLSIASHELKTPLTSLRLLVETLRRMGRKGGRLDAPEVEERLRAIDRQAVRLSGLSDELLDISRIRLGRLELKFDLLDFAELVEETAARFEEEAKAAGSELRLQVDAHAPGRWDRIRVEQILTNLLSNAVKYGAGAPIDVHLEVSADTVRLTVRDRGIGIAADHQTRIFERFERAVSARHFGGLGLGLYIARQIVNAHGGEIGVRSIPGEGSTFTVVMPRWFLGEAPLEGVPHTTH
jgi:PAS domain S-box-containing protein